MSTAYICEGVRTPIGRYAGALAPVRTDDLAAVPLAALRRQFESSDWESIDDVFYGCTNQAGEDNRNVARMASLLAGLPVSVPAATVNRLCGSGMEAVAVAARAIAAGEIALAIAGGVESMSRAPLVIPKAASAFSRNAEIHDSTLGWRFVNPLMRERFGVASMPETAENVAEAYKIDRCAQDRFAFRSQQKAAAAQAAGIFAEEIMPVAVPGPNDTVKMVSIDEHPRPHTTLEALAKLPTPFREGGTVTAGNASGINDGACRAFRGFGECRRAIRIDADGASGGYGDRRRRAGRDGHRSAFRDTKAARSHQSFDLRGRFYGVKRGLCGASARRDARARPPR